LCPTPGGHLYLHKNKKIGGLWTKSKDQGQEGQKWQIFKTIEKSHNLDIAITKTHPIHVWVPVRKKLPRKQQPYQQPQTSAVKCWNVISQGNQPNRVINNSTSTGALTKAQLRNPTKSLNRLLALQFQQLSYSITISQAPTVKLTEGLKKNQIFIHRWATNRWKNKDLETQKNMILISGTIAKESKTTQEQQPNHQMNQDQLIGEDLVIREEIADLGNQGVDLEFHLGQVEHLGQV
jgi:hypothetical protein